MQTKAEALKARIALYRNCLRAGVAGAVAIEYLRRIAEDTEALSKLPGVQCTAAAGDRAPVSPYLRHPRRALFLACREAGRDAGGHRCASCSVKAICDASRLSHADCREACPAA